MPDERTFTIEFHQDPIVYKLDVGKKSVDKALNELKIFVKNNNIKVLEAAAAISAFDPKARLKLLAQETKTCRMPDWFYKTKSKIAVPDTIALILYFAGKPLSMREITNIFNTEARAIDLRNISKYLTSKGKELYGYTTYDEVTERYGLNEHGKTWIQAELISKIKAESKSKLTNRMKNKGKRKIK